MARTPPDIAKSILAKLAVTAPEMSFALGTPERKIVDAASEAISEAYFDQYLTGSLLDIETKTGMELEQFVGIFGFGRLHGRQATGVVRVEMNTANPQDLGIPVGTQFYTKAGLAGVSQQLYYTSTQAVVLTANSYSVDVPVECTTPGAQGNVPADSVVAVSSMIGTASCTNLAPMTGGVDIETDGELRQRFKDTMLRNISGTADWYRGLAIQNKNVSKVAVFGPTNIYRTQITAPSTSGLVNVNQNVKYVWPKSSSVFNDIGTNQVYYNEGLTEDYTLSSGLGAPTFTRISSGDIDNGEVLNLEFEYTPHASRNEPNNGIFNKVDVYVDGIDPYTVTERTVINDDVVLVNSPGAELHKGNFDRVGSTGDPSEDNRFTRLASTPIVSFPSTLTINSVVYTQGEDYHLLHGTTLLAGSPVETAGIEWEETGPSDGQAITFTYTYNRVPQVLQAMVNASKQICTDVLVHQAKYRYIKPCINVQFDRSASVPQVKTAINEHLRAWFTPFPFGAQFKITDLLVAVRGVPGVSNVSLTTVGQSPSAYGVRIYPSSEDATANTGATIQTTDFQFDDNMIPIFVEAVFRREATP